MTKAAPPDVKRRRISPGDSPHEGITCLTDLPSGILAYAATFLAAPSRALFAIALDEDSTVATNERSSAIVGNQLDVLDFGEIEKDLAKKFRDLDIKRVLLCIDAVNNVKRLKLTNCTNIFGTCLGPLRGSTMIEQIDLSLDGQNPDPDPEPPISCDHVLPILDSIIAREGCALMHLHFPKVWRKEPESEFDAFIARYNQMRRNQGTVTCFKCSEILPAEGGEAWIEDEFSYYGTQLHTCYGCLKHYCYVCNIDGVSTKMLHVCSLCECDYCKVCSELTSCDICEKDICYDCCKYECVQCDKKFCSECGQTGKSGYTCEYCDKCYCRGCYDDEEVDVVFTWCSRCDVKCCDDCRLRRYRQGQLHCSVCIKHSEATGEGLKHKLLQEENEELKVEMEALKRQIKDLKLENDELRSRNIE